MNEINSELTSSNEKLKNELVDKDNEYNELNGKISSYEDQINSATNEIQILSDAKDELNKSIVEKDKNIAELLNKNKDSETEIARLNSIVDEKSDSLDKASSTLDSKVNEISKLNDQLNEKDEEIRYLNEKLANVSSSASDSTIDSLKEEIENLKKEKDELCSSLAELSQKEKASEYEVQRLNEELKVKEPKDESEDVDTDKLSQDLLSSLNLGDDNN